MTAPTSPLVDLSHVVEHGMITYKGLPNDQRPLHAIVEELSRRCSVDWFYEYYSNDRISSAAARAGWVEPDLKPLDF
jgi:hypothetical protein